MMPLAANWIEALLPIIAVLGWVVKAFLEARGSSQAEPEPDDELIDLNSPDDEREQGDRRRPGEADRDGDRDRGRDRRPAARDAAGAGLAVGAAAGTVRGRQAAEIDDFLARLEQQSGGATAPRASGRKPSAAEQMEQRRAEARARRAEERRRIAERRAAQQRTLEQQRALEAEKTRRPSADAGSRAGSRAEARGESVEDHVREHIGRLRESQLAENASHLGEQLAQTDERMAARLHEKFDTKLGRLGERASDPSQPAAGAAGDGDIAGSIAEMLANPEGVRNAVLLNEILQRPTDRW